MLKTKKMARFEVTGDMQVKGHPVHDIYGDICGYKQKDGSIIKLVVALEVQNKAGNEFRYLHSDKDMRAMGFGIDDYDQTEFIEILN